MGRFQFSSDYEEEYDEDEDEIAYAGNGKDERSLAERSPTSSAEKTTLMAAAHRVMDDVLPAQSPAFIVAYQRNGTPVLVPFQPPTHPHEKRRTNWSLWIVFMAVLIQIVRRYGPPAPGPLAKEDETWEQFLERESLVLIQSMSTLLSVVPHVLQWCGRSIHADIIDAFHPPPCPMSLPQDWSSTLDRTLIGQSRAVSITAQALQAWTREKALILVFSGTVGVGKLRLAKHVAQSTVCESAILELVGRTFSDRLDFLSQVKQHVARGDSVVILQQPQDMAPLLLQNSLEALSTIPNLIFIITTHVGSRITHQHLRQEAVASLSSSSLSSSSMDWSLRQELDDELGPVSDYITAVAPFVPLGKKELQHILIQNVERMSHPMEYKSITMTNELAQVWTTSEFVEYLEWKAQGRTILTFSTLGGKFLDGEIRQRLVSQVHQCLVPGDTQSTIATTTTTATTTTVELDWDPDEKEAVIRSCQDETTSQQDNADVMCEEVCRFELSV